MNNIDKKKLLKPSLSYTSSSKYKKLSNVVNPYLQCLGTPHIDSFNFILEGGLRIAVENLEPVYFTLASGQKVKLWLEDATISKPIVPLEVIGVRNMNILPTECRQRGATYKGELRVRINVQVDDRVTSFDQTVGRVPIMIKSKLCHLDNMTPQQLVNNNEHADEWGGYFITKGHEKLVRMLQTTRRNFPVAIKRPSWKIRGNLFSDYGIMFRCVTADQTNTTNVLHFIQNGTCKLMLSYRRTMYYAPLILIMKCLYDCPDHYIYRLLLNGHKDDLYYVNCVQNMLRELHDEGLHTSIQCRTYLGKMFSSKLNLPPDSSNLYAADFLLENSVLIHLDSNVDKFHSLVYATQKLYSVVQNKSKCEGADAVMVQELLLGGHIYLLILKERLQHMLNYMRINIKKKEARTSDNFEFTESEMIRLVKLSNNVEAKMESFISTGNAPSNHTNLVQYKGLSIVAENINRMRYMGHFKSIHRGAFFMEMRTTDARQLLPDAWGFICPVHTPDGAPCGLLNHLTMTAQVTPVPDLNLVKNLPLVLEKCGMDPVSSVYETPLANDVYKYPVFVDGKLVGFFDEDTVEKSAACLRTIKIKGIEMPYMTEIVVVPKKDICSPYPGVFLFTSEARIMRPVINLSNGQLEMIGTMEQVFLDIAVVQAEIYKGRTTHLELSKTAFLSNLAMLVPMPDCNQSPRNMYQCQMGKQTMGTPIHNWPTNAETKLYRLQTPATPLFRPTHYDNIGLDDFPCGTNAIVAVISYTGYDMEDAMIINKSSYDRGFAAGFVYKTDNIELKNNTEYFMRDPAKENLAQYMDEDGLPFAGTRLTTDDPLFCFYSTERNLYLVRHYRGKEEAVIDSVRIMGDFNPKAPQKVSIVLRIRRNPSVGDKFASRAGQKGICSQIWPTEDLPFTESGLVPDILFNPHGFPSRMTIAMMIELMAGKAGSVHGHVHDATPFRFNEKDTAINYFGRLLEAGGYNYYGTERMYSGVDGREMTADIFFGVIHYQRLRHMVSDKWQVRTTGPIDALTHQPVKGRKRGGGIRLGEMERDALISHGASFILQDRLFHCSDKTNAILCTKCGTLAGPILNVTQKSQTATCRLCTDGNLVTISIPHVFKLFITQLAAVNIKIKINCNNMIK